MSSGHIIVGLKRTLTVDSLMVAQSRISTTYNITVDDVRQSVLKPCPSNILVKIVDTELNKQTAASLYVACTHLSNRHVFHYHNPMHSISNKS